MFWDGPMDGVSDCSPRLIELLNYAKGSKISVGSDTLNPWSSLIINQQRKVQIAGGASGFQFQYQTTEAHGLQSGDVFTVVNCVPSSWNGTFTATDGTAGNIIYCRSGVSLPVMTTAGQIVVTLPPRNYISPARDCIIEFPAGQFSLRSPLPPLGQVVIKGQSKLSTILIKRFHGGVFFQQDGSLGNGLIIERMAVLADPLYRPGYFCYLAGKPALKITGASGPTAGMASITTNKSHGIAVGGSFVISGCVPSEWNGTYIATSGSGVNQLNFALGGSPGGMTTLGQVDTPYQPDNFQLKDLYVSQFGGITGASPPGGGLWQYGVVIDGADRTHPQGIRIGLIENCEIFNCQIAGVWIKNGVGITMRGGGLFPGAGPADGTGVYVTGGLTDPLTQSIYCHFQGVINNCALNISRSSYCTWLGGSIGGLQTEGSGHHWRIDTLNSGPVGNNLADSSVTLLPPP
jgi:hypothetical protein